MPCSVLLCRCFCCWAAPGCGSAKAVLRQRALELQPLADEHDLLEVKIQKEKKAPWRRAVETNQAMARAMANVRSSSALLAELQRLVPQTIRLDQARISGNALELNGEALMPDGLRTLNALMLSLGQSALFDEDGVTLQQASLKGFAATGLLIRSASVMPCLHGLHRMHPRPSALSWPPLGPSV